MFICRYWDKSKVELRYKHTHTHTHTCIYIYRQVFIYLHATTNIGLDSQNSSHLRQSTIEQFALSLFEALTKGLIDVTAIVLCTVIQVLVSRFLFFSWHTWWWIADSLWKMDLRVKKALFFCFYPMIIFGSFGLFLFLIVFLVVYCR